MTAGLRDEFVDTPVTTYLVASISTKRLRSHIESTTERNRRAYELFARLLLADDPPNVNV